MSQISRRSVAKGAAWSVPAIAIGAAAPAFAASETDPDNPPEFIVDCATAAVGLSGASNYTHVVAPGGSRHTWNIGYLSISPPPGYNITGYRMRWGQIRTYTVAGTVHVAENVIADLETAQAVPFGAALAPTFSTNMPYSATCLEANEHVIRMEADFCMVWLRGLTPTAPNSQNCCYTIVSEWNPNKAGIACSDKYRAAAGDDKSRAVIF